jgi:integrase
MGRYPFLTVGMQYLERRKPFLAKSTVEDLERKVYLINTVFTELRKRGAVSTTNPNKMVQQDIGAFVKHMETEKPKEGAGMNGRKKGQRVKTASRNYLVGLLHLLKKVCAFAGNNVFTQMEVQGDPIPRKLPKDLSSLNERELARISAAADEMEGWKGEVARFIVAVYPYTGVRYNELRLAHFEDIDVEEWTIFVRHPKGEKRYARQRTAPILPPAREAVLRFLEVRDQRLKAKGVEQTEALIPAWHNDRFDFYSYTNLRRIKNEIEERASRNGKPLKFHIKTFRDTYVQMNIDRDPSLLSQVSVTVGHATTRTTEESYGRISVKRSVSDLNRSWEAVQVPRCKKPLIDEKVGITG